MAANKPNVNPEEVKNEEIQAKKAPAVPKKTPASAKRKAEETDPEEAIESAIQNTESWIFRNGKILLTILAVALVIVGGYLGYKYLYLTDRAEKAGDMMFVAQQLFEEGNYEKALNGDDNNAGFLQVIEKYGNTPQGNIANHYAGVCYMKAGDADNAIKYLAKYEATKGVPNKNINSLNLGLQGDAMSQKGDYAKAADLYKKAADAGDNVLTSPLYLKKLGMVYLKLGKKTEAEAAFRQIIDKYPASMEARDADKYVGMAEQE